MSPATTGARATTVNAATIDDLSPPPDLTRLDAMLTRLKLMARRYEQASTILTSSKGFEEWGEVFGDPVVATAILDRLLHHSHVLTIRGESYRLREKRRAGLLGTSGAPSAASESSIARAARSPDAPHTQGVS